jgi:predicted RNA-binding Zn-ribbon protein involved in translation (DUF1610 family)
MADTTRLFKCPTCGGPLEPPAGASTMKCPYCGNVVIVPESLRTPARPEYMSAPAAMDLNAFGEEMAEVVRLARGGQKIEAIKLYRETTGVGLAEAKAAVEAMEAGQSVSFSPSSNYYPQGDYVQQATEGAVKTSRNIARTIGCSIAAIFVCVGLVTAVSVLASVGAGVGGLAAFLPIVRSVGPTIAAPLETASASGIIPTAVGDTSGFASAVLTFGKEGSGPGSFGDPRSIAVDRAGDIYVADYQDGRIQRFDPQGGFSQLINVGQKKIIRGLAVAGDGKLYALYDGEAHIFDSKSGADLGQFEYADDHYFDDVAVGADGKLVFVSNGEDILVFNPDGTLNLSIPAAISTVSGDSELEARVAVDGLGNIYALGTFNDGVFKFSPTGQFQNRFGAQGDEPGKFQAVDAIAVDGQGRIYVSDIHGVQVFDSDGAYLNSFGGPAELGGVIFGMAFDLQDNLYAASNKPEIIKFQVASQ